MATQWTVSALAAGLPGGQSINETYTIVGANVIGETLSLNLASGDNTIAVPSGAISVGIVLPNTNNQTVKFRTSLNSTDAGLTLSATDQFGPYVFRGLTVASIILNASATVTGVQVTFLG